MQSHNGRGLRPANPLSLRNSFTLFSENIKKDFRDMTTNNNHNQKRKDQLIITRCFLFIYIRFFLFYASFCCWEPVTTVSIKPTIASNNHKPILQLSLNTLFKANNQREGAPPVIGSARALLQGVPPGIGFLMKHENWFAIGFILINHHKFVWNEPWKWTGKGLLNHAGHVNVKHFLKCKFDLWAL